MRNPTRRRSREADLLADDRLAVDSGDRMASPEPTAGRRDPSLRTPLTGRAIGLNVGDTMSRSGARGAADLRVVRSRNVVAGAEW
jgi:hypothetical protein